MKTTGNFTFLPVLCYDVGLHQAGTDIPRHEKSSAEQGGVEATYTCRTCLRAEHLMTLDDDLYCAEDSDALFS